MNVRPRSPSYPRRNLPETLKRLEQVWKALQSHAAERDVIVEAMGYSSPSGATDSIISSLRQFGLLDSAGKGNYRISELGKTYLHPRSKEERNQSLQQMAELPKVFSAIRKEFPGKLPSDTLIRNFLIREGFSETGADQALSAFNKTAEFLESQFEESNATMTEDQESEKPKPAAGDLTPDVLSGKEAITELSLSNTSEIKDNQFTVLFTAESRVNIAAFKLDRASVKRLIDWLNVNKEFISEIKEENDN